VKQRRAKRRVRSQRIGEIGESVFRTWATEQHLSAAKHEYDYGIDFFCTVLREISAEAEELSGATLSVQVRATSVEDKQRISIDRADAETALRIDGPYALVGVDILTKQVWFRFMDDALVGELQAFLQSDADSHSWSLESMGSGNEHFAEMLTKVCRPAYQQHLRWVRANLDVAAVVPGSRLSFRQDEHGGIIVVTVPCVTAVFSIGSAQQEEAARLVFEEGCLPGDATRFPLRPEVLSLCDLVDGPVCVVGPLERQATLSIECPGVPRITIPAGFRMVGDQFGYVLRTGLYLHVSNAREKDERWVHDFGYGIATGGTLELEKAEEEFRFLKALREGATVILENGSPIPINLWGNLKYLGPDLDVLERAFAHLGLSWTDLHLSDTVERGLLMATGVIGAFLDGTGIESICPGFVYEQAIDGKPRDENWRPCGFRVPIVMNLRSAGVVIWCTGQGDVYISEGQVCGFRPRRQEKWDTEMRDKPFSGVALPELWFCQAWPPIPLDAHERGQSVSLEYRAELPFGGEVYGLADLEQEEE
jgi:hypothetical protein